MAESGFDEFWNNNCDGQREMIKRAYDAGFKAGVAAGAQHAQASVLEKIKAALSTDGESSVGVSLDDVAVVDEFRLVSHISPSAPGRMPLPARASDRLRAPKGLPKALVDRVLYDLDVLGVRLQDIMNEAKTEHEKMIAASTIRGVLRKGAKDGHYEEKNGYWGLTEAYKEEIKDRYDD